VLVGVAEDDELKLLEINFLDMDVFDDDAWRIVTPPSPQPDRMMPTILLKMINLSALPTLWHNWL